MQPIHNSETFAGSWFPYMSLYCPLLALLSPTGDCCHKLAVDARWRVLAHSAGEIPPRILVHKTGENNLFSGSNSGLSISRSLDSTLGCQRHVSSGYCLLVSTGVRTTSTLLDYIVYSEALCIVFSRLGQWASSDSYPVSSIECSHVESVNVHWIREQGRVKRRRGTEQLNQQNRTFNQTCKYIDTYTLEN
ncbi:hypothetical protein KQX54_010048 [Cotesia glomerata]|uniref:Uncharacterized protein n=1 Tax=Cotesia glomerata TaxID=32391 RepID=A0AAV7J2S2_COTGL|nr:hypothetical protein KQX54_010048 [Cotesia glomerata]